MILWLLAQDGSLLVLFQRFLTNAFIEQAFGSLLKSLLVDNTVTLLFSVLFTFCPEGNDLLPLSWLPTHCKLMPK